MKDLNRQNKICFGLGTIGRDMFYATVSMFLTQYYLIEVLDIPDSTMWWITAMIVVLRIFDAINDPIMGVIVDNTRSRFGKFKPWILGGAILGAVFMVLMFTDLGLTGAGYVAMLGICYLFWDITYGANDIAYWSMLPSLTMEQKEREKMGAFARICANIGLFAVVVGILPVTNAIGSAVGSLPKAWTIFAAAVSVLMIGIQLITVIGVKENRSVFKQEEPTRLSDMFRVIFGNDQLLITAVAMALFTIGYSTTTSFGTLYFKYVFRDENMYSIFAAILGVTQLASLAVFPFFSKRFDRRQLYTGSTVLVVLGYIVFFFAPNNMLVIGIAGLLLFAGQAFIQLLILMFLADTIEYGQWRTGKRNESVIFSVQPVINKLGGAIASGVVLATSIVSGINAAKTPDDVGAGGIMLLKIAMLVLPLLCIGVAYVIYRFKYKIDRAFYEKIVGELEARGDIRTAESAPTEADPDEPIDETLKT